MTVSKTRTRLVDVARGLFAKQGLENTTMNDIAVASGKGRRTLYTYFKNKEDIYFAVIETELEHLSAQLSEVANKRMDLEENWWKSFMSICIPLKRSCCATVICVPNSSATSGWWRR